MKDDLVGPLLQAVKSYELQTNRKEMIYDNMLAHMLRICRLAPPDSLDAALLDWIILGRYTGARRSEWCQVCSNFNFYVPVELNGARNFSFFGLRALFFFFSLSLPQLTKPPTTIDGSTTNLIPLNLILTTHKHSF